MESSTEHNSKIGTPTARGTADMTARSDHADFSDYFIGPNPDWANEYVTRLSRTIRSADNPFPCTFALAGSKKGTLRYAFVEDLWDESTWHVLPKTMNTYISTYHSTGRETSLIVFYGSSGEKRSISEY